MTRTATIYGLSDPRTGRLRYVGVTMRDVQVRLREHLKTTSTPSKRYITNWLRQLVQAGLEPTVTILEVTTEDRWEEAERHWIAKSRADGARLVNRTSGGEGAHDLRHTDKTRAKLRARRAEQVISDEQRAKMSVAARGNQHALGNKITRTPEHQAKLVDARDRNGTYLVSEETREKLAAAARGNANRRGAVLSPETRAKISASRRRSTS